jgi:hypothetical protein
VGSWCSVHFVPRVVFGVRDLTETECFGVFVEIVWGVDDCGGWCWVECRFFVAMMCDMYMCVWDVHG